MEIKEKVGLKQLSLIPGQLNLMQAESIINQRCVLTLSPLSQQVVNASYHCVQNHIKQGARVYGVNTGFGSLANQVIAPNKICALQRHLLLSHATGVGNPLDVNVVRLIILLKINSLSQGNSGIRYELLMKLVELFNSSIVPYIPEKGSVGASGDLAPLAHCFLPLIGEGKVFYRNKLVHAQSALQQSGLSAVVLQEKEGLALINGTQVSTAIAVTGLIQARRCLSNAISIGALTTMAVGGNTDAFHHGIQQIRKQLGQIQVARLLRNYLQGYQSPKLRVQDPYCIRCQPQVLGACWDVIAHANDVLEREMNAVTDNPLVFVEEEVILSGGNFHAEPVAMACDYLALALAEIGSLSERRMALLVDSKLSGLPAFLASEPGLHSGFMIAHVTAAALVSENKQLATPASVDSIPTSANQEDHVSMATNAARRLLTMAENVSTVLAIEMMATYQAKYSTQHQCHSSTLTFLWNKIGKKINLYHDDRVLSDDINTLKAWLLKEEVLK